MTVRIEWTAPMTLNPPIHVLSPKENTPLLSKINGAFPNECLSIRMNKTNTEGKQKMTLWLH